MTTAFSHTANFDFRRGFLAQPMGMVLAVFCATLVWPLLHVVAMGSNVGTLVMRCANGRTGAALVLLVLAAWAYKVLTWGT